MAAVCCALVLCILSGCQLALENAGANVYEDRLIGVFVTNEHLDLFDFEGYLNDNPGSLQGGEITLDGNTKRYQGRLYATMTTSSATNEETGQTMLTEEYVFEGIEGMSYFAPTVRAAEDHESYITTMSDEAFSDVHIGLNHGEDKSSTTLDATIYTTLSSKNQIYYLNPVFQSMDGSVYVVSGNGFMVSSNVYSEGSVFSQSLDSTTTITENGKAKTGSISIKISISVMFAPKKIVLLQMSTDNTLLSRTEYEPDAMPKSFEPETDTAYLIVETHKRDDTGNIKIFREIYGRDVENIETFFARADGICVKHLIQSIWR